MAAEASNILEYMLYMVWMCLTLTPRNMKNPVYALVFASKDMLQLLLSNCLLEFAPGLLEVFQAASPPSITYLKSLPDCKQLLKQIWAVYLLVLEKPDCRPRIYVGSGTDSKGGVDSRLVRYESYLLSTKPVYVQQAFDEGYTITHKGLLCWIAIPTPAKAFPVRVLFVAMETTFSIILRAMRNRTKDYGLPSLSPWSSESMPYDGLCSHSALKEGIPGEEDGLTLEEINAKQVELDKIREKLVHMAQVLNPARRATNLASEKFKCVDCDQLFSSKLDLDRHYTSQKHLDKAAGVKKVLREPKAPQY